MVSHPAFDMLIMIIAIINNSVLLSMADYCHVTASNELSEDGSSINYVIPHDNLCCRVSAESSRLRILFERFY